ncbi:MAG: class I SAM-dependent methyltransferase [Bacteroidota bacterium]
MKKTIDNFSKQSGIYKKFRPEYPQALYEVLLSHAKHRDACWDCGTGNGQVAKELAKYFKQVEATDISENQIKLAEKRPNINFQVARVEATPFKENQFDLITVAQAMHWFDFKAFNAEVKRVGKSGSSICIWGYDLLRIDKKVDPIIKTFIQILSVLTGIKNANMWI